MNLKKSRVYAQVLFEEDSSPEFLKYLKTYSDILTEEDSIFSFFLSLSIPLKEKLRLLDQALKPAPQLLKRFFTVLLNNKSFFLLSEIVKNYQNLLDEKNNQLRAVVFSAQNLNEAEKSALKKALESFFNKKIELQEKEDKNLIAGLRVDVEGYVFQANTRQFLKNFEKPGGL